MPDSQAVSSNAKNATDVIPIRTLRGASNFQAPTAKGYVFRRSDANAATQSGMANATGAWTADTPMHLGIVGEAITHAAAHLLIQRGTLAAGDKVVTLLGLTAPTFAQVTVADLIAHTSGIAGDTPTKDPVVDFGTGPGTLGGLTGYIAAYLVDAKSPTPRAPGLPMVRNFFDTTLLQAVIEAKTVSDGGYVKFVQDKLLAPMGLDASTFASGSIRGTAAERTLAYHGQDDQNGFDWENHGFFAWYDWVAMPNALLVFMWRIRTDRTILNQATLDNLFDGSTAWRRDPAKTVVYIGGNNTWAKDEDNVPAPFPGLAVAAASTTPADGNGVDAVLFANSPVTDVVNRVVNAIK